VTARVALFASGEGSNVRALVEGQGPSWAPALLVSDRPDAPVVAWGAARGLPVHLLPPRGEDPEGEALLGALEGARIDLVVLAGFLRLVPAPIVRRWMGRVLNIHPSLLPAFGGAGMYGRRVHEAVLAAGVRVTGVTVHEVTECFDEGPILVQWPVLVRSDDTPMSLAARIQSVEHQLYPAVVEGVARAFLTGVPLGSPESLTPSTLVFP
jgi:phosphoribosylglycinamide formyltransferase-1